jgi:small-conductance mechanosensitive channel/CRP-like cAMP-binding protein
VTSLFQPLSLPEPRGLWLLLLALLLYLVGLALGRWAKRKLQIRLGWMSHLFIASFAVVAASRLLIFDYPGASEIGLVAVVSAAWPINAIVQRFIWPLYGYPGESARIPSFLPQIAALVTIVVLSFAGLGFFYHITVPGLLAGSGVIAIILGIALQDTLANIFAGLGLQTGRAYRVGDWLLVDGGHVEVTEINWRSTRFRNNDRVSLDIPNSQLAKATLVNLYYPNPLHAVRVRVSVDHRVPPNEVKEALARAAANAAGVLDDPPVQVYLIDFGEASLRYEIKIWMMDGARFMETLDAVRTNVWYELNRRGIKLTFSVQQIELTRRPVEYSKDSIDPNLIGCQSLFSALDNNQLEGLATAARRIRFGRGERMIEEGAYGDSMFILTRGSAEVLVTKEGVSIPVGSLNEGDCFGEYSLLTGEPRSATVVARVDCEVVEIEKESLGILLRQDPKLAESLSESAMIRRSATEAELSRLAALNESQPVTTTKEGFLRRIRYFFKL